MSEALPLYFGPYRLAGPKGPLFRGDRRLKLKPKTLGVLWQLARQAGEVVTKTDLHDALWPRSIVGEDALSFQIQALRRALEDDARQPRYIATFHRVGYSFVAPVTAGAPAVAAQPESAPTQPAVAEPQGATTFVGRDTQMACLHQHYAKALRGERQLVFVSGEAGIGKTSLVESFLAQVSDVPRIGHGQCVAQHGAGEAYLPVLQALGHICRQPHGGQVIDVLMRIAPTWLMQLPALLSPHELTALQRRTAGAARERMLREIADALEALTAETPLILVLEDLHWSDPSTIEMLSLVARRSAPARLFIVGTYRPSDAGAVDRPLKSMKQELVAHAQTVEIALGNLGHADVRTYLARRFPGSGDESDVSAFVYRRTEGHPLFMVQMTDYLARQGAQGAIASALQEASETAVPHGLRELIDVQLGRLTDTERQVLETASVAGAEFSTASVGAAARMPVENVETCCEGLARHGQFIEARGLATWPDGTASGRYGFRHVLYKDVLYGRLSTRRLTRIHLDIATREEAAYGELSTELAAELATHFERGLDHRRAVHHYHQAGQKALRRFANAEAIAHFTKGLDLLQALPDTLERARDELRLQVDLSLALTMSKGYSAVEVEKVSARALELCRLLDETPEISSALFRIGRFYLVCGQIHTAREIGDRLLRIARHARTPALLSQAHTASAFEFFSLGDFSAAQDHAEQSISLYDPRRYRTSGVVFADDTVGVSYVIRAFALQVRGYPDQALASLQKGVDAARELSVPFARGGALLSMADLHLLRSESQSVREFAEATIAHSIREGFPYYVSRATVLRGWALADQGELAAGIAEIRRGLDAFEAMGARLWMPCCLGLLAEVLGKSGKVDEGLALLAEALEIAGKTGEREYEAELHRLKGELMLLKMPLNRKSGAPGSLAAEECFHRAIAVARQQGAKLFELRASASLAQSWRRTGKRKAAHLMLSEISGWFTEGFDTKDLRAAKALLSELTPELSP